MLLKLSSVIVTLWLCCGSLSLTTTAMAEETSSPTKLEPLPNPLSLEQALKLADVAHPDLLRAKAEVDEARAP